MKFIVCFVIILTISFVSYGQEKQIRTTSISNSNYYTFITFLSEGEINWSDEGPGNAFRTIISTSEIYNNLILEKVEYGEEGGKKIVDKRKIDLDNLWDVYGLTGEIMGIQFIQWLAWDSFEIRIHKSNYEIKDIDSPQVQVIRK